MSVNYIDFYLFGYYFIKQIFCKFTEGCPLALTASTLCTLVHVSVSVEVCVPTHRNLSQALAQQKLPVLLAVALFPSTHWVPCLQAVSLQRFILLVVPHSHFLPALLSPHRHPQLFLAQGLISSVKCNKLLDTMTWCWFATWKIYCRGQAWCEARPRADRTARGFPFDNTAFLYCRIYTGWKVNHKLFN